MSARPLPTPDEVLAAIERVEPATCDQIQMELGCPWEQRGTVRNRVYELVDRGLVIGDEGRPEQYAINHLVGADA